MKLKFSGQIFETYTKLRFDQNPSSGSQVVLCRWVGTETDRKKDRQTLWS